MGFTYSEAYRLPIWQRQWFVERLKKELKGPDNKEEYVHNKAAHNNDPQTRALMGLRPDAPAKLRRFT